MIVSATMLWENVALTTLAVNNEESCRWWQYFGVSHEHGLLAT